MSRPVYKFFHAIRYFAVQWNWHTIFSFPTFTLTLTTGQQTDKNWDKARKRKMLLGYRKLNFLMTERYIFYSLSVISVTFLCSDLFFTWILLLQPTLLLHGKHSLSPVMQHITTWKRNVKHYLVNETCICQLQCSYVYQITADGLMDFYTTVNISTDASFSWKVEVNVCPTNETHINLDTYFQ